ncbi:MAG: DUF1036 domain-containing protein [Hyphomicrobiales bacterium]|nr:DUF1036 domain-containing protein [Hyphomicrobiales bacterium]
MTLFRAIGWIPRDVRASLYVLAAVLVGSAMASTPAVADLRLCNKTQSRVSVAVGYKDHDGWATEGWWNLEGDSCQKLLEGTLISRFYYIYAIDVDNGGEWGGPAYMCTQDKQFTIHGIKDCVARGLEKTGFFEIDTGEQSSWTVQLTEPTETGSAQ